MCPAALASGLLVIVQYFRFRMTICITYDKDCGQCDMYFSFSYLIKFINFKIYSLEIAESGSL